MPLMLPTLRKVHTRNTGPLRRLNPTHRLNQGLVAWYLPQADQPENHVVHELVQDNHGQIVNLRQSNGASGLSEPTRPGGFGEVWFEKTAASGVLLKGLSGVYLTGATLTLAFWFYPRTLGAFTILIDSDTASASRALNLSIDTTTSGYYALGGDTGNPLTWTIPWTLGAWNHLILTWDNGNAADIYKNTEQNYTISDVGGAGFAACDLWLGAVESGGGETPYDGAMDDIRFWNRVLSASERQEVFDTSQQEHAGVLLPVRPRRRIFVVQASLGKRYPFRQYVWRRWRY